MSRIAAKKLNRDKNQQSPWNSKRGYYRKKVDLECTYVPLHPEPEARIRLKGRIHDISMGGLGLSIDRKNLSIFPHRQGDFVFIDTVLPNGKRLKAEAVINSIKANGKVIQFGMSFHKLSDDKFGARKTLGWYLMPA
jgi:hypothetical protein